jgi:hypothetical protein
MHYSIAPESGQHAHHAKGRRAGAIAIGKKDDKYYILCGNVVTATAVNALNDKLLEIHNMSKEEIKKAYKRQLQSEADDSSHGAGLGFLTVARDSVEPIEYSFFKPADTQEGHAFFYIKATIV